MYIITKNCAMTTFFSVLIKTYTVHDDGLQDVVWTEQVWTSWTRVGMLVNERLI